MDIVGISNVFNALVQLHKLNSTLDRKLKFYTCGTIEKINQSGIDNNFDKGNSTGKMYPLLLFPYDAKGTLSDVSSTRIKNQMDIEWVFSDLMFYDNDSRGNNRTEVEIVRDLQNIAKEMFNGLHKAIKVEQNNNARNGFSIIGDVQYTIIPHVLSNDDVMTLWCSFKLQWQEICTPFIPNFGDLPADTPLPVKDRDYENYKNIQD